MLFRPHTVQVGLVDTVAEFVAVQRDEPLVEAFHFRLPLPLCNERLWTNHQNTLDIRSRLQLFENQPSLDRLSHANSVSDEKPRSLSPYQFQHRAELVGNAVDACGVQRVND